MSTVAAHTGALSAWPMNYLRSDGPRADPVTALTWGLIWLSLGVSLVIGVLVVWGVLARRAPLSPGGMGAMGVERSAGGLKWIWIGLALTMIALVAVLIWTIAVIRSVDSPTARPVLTLDVTGHQWWWEVTYRAAQASETFTTANEIHIPVGQPVLVELKSADVIHSFWIPALSGKTDTIPGRTNISWLQADHPGVFRGQCAEFCGVQHAHMALAVVADPPAAFEAWRRAQIAPTPPAPPALLADQMLFEARCGACHTVRGTKAGGVVGPDLTHLMSRASLAAGTLPNNAAGRLGWIGNPQALKPGARMPATDLSAAELARVGAYLETLQ